MWIKLGLCLHLAKRSSLLSTPWWNISKEKSTENAETEITPRSGVAFYSFLFEYKKKRSIQALAIVVLAAFNVPMVSTHFSRFNKSILDGFAVVSMTFSFLYENGNTKKTLTHFAENRNKNTHLSLNCRMVFPLYFSWFMFQFNLYSANSSQNHFEFNTLASAVTLLN